MTSRQSPKKDSTLSASSLQLTNQEIAVQLVRGFLASGKSPVMESKPLEVQTADTLLARSNLDSYYIATLYQQTLFWLSKNKSDTPPK